MKYVLSETLKNVATLTVGLSVLYAYHALTTQVLMQDMLDELKRFVAEMKQVTR